MEIIMSKPTVSERIFSFLERIPIFHIITLIIGVLLVVFPSQTLATVLRVSGIMMLVYAIYKLFSVFVLRSDIFSSSLSLFSTFVTIAVGVILIAEPLLVGGVVSALFGLYLLARGGFDIWRITVRRAHLEFFGLEENKKARVIAYVLACVNVVVGIVLMIFPLATQNFTAVIVGICLAVESVKSIIAICAKERVTRKNIDDKPGDIEVDFIDKTGGEQ